MTSHSNIYIYIYIYGYIYGYPRYWIDSGQLVAMSRGRDAWFDATVPPICEAGLAGGEAELMKGDGFIPGQY